MNRKPKALADNTTIMELFKLARKEYRRGEVLKIFPTTAKDRNSYYLHVVPMTKPAKSKIKDK